MTAAARTGPPRRFAVAAAGLLAVTAAIGWMHTAQGMRLLRAAGLPCPVTRATAADVMKVRDEGIAQVRSDRDTPQRAALGFVLESTTLAQARSWAAANHVACDEVTRGLRFLRCRAVAARSVGVSGPPISEMWLSFRPDGRLLAVDVYRRGLDDGGEATAWSDAVQRLRAALGPPSRRTGSAAPAVLRASPLETARIEYRFRQYAATVTAANLPYAGLAVREQYLSLRP